MLCPAYNPYMTYCIEIWVVLHKSNSIVYFYFKKNNQNNEFLTLFAHTNPLFLSMEALSLRKYFLCTVGIITYKYFNNLLPECIAELYCEMIVFYEQNTRGRYQIRVLPGAKTFSNMSTQMWNVFTSKINCDVSTSIFKVIEK